MSEPEWREAGDEMVNVPLLVDIEVTMGQGVNEEGGFDAVIFTPTLRAQDGSLVRTAVCMPVEMAQAMQVNLGSLLLHYEAKGAGPPDERSAHHPDTD